MTLHTSASATLNRRLNSRKETCWSLHTFLFSVIRQQNCDSPPISSTLQPAWRFIPSPQPQCIPGIASRDRHASHVRPLDLSLPRIKRSTAHQHLSVFRQHDATHVQNRNKNAQRNNQKHSHRPFHTFWAFPIMNKTSGTLRMSPSFERTLLCTAWPQPQCTARKT